MSATAPDRETVLAALERLLAWPDIARSPQLGRFLDYIVRRTLDDEEQAIKAYSIAVDVFGRAADFDPQVDPIVRVQARRLRSLLAQYYASVGAAEKVHIGLPVGRYVPVFHDTWLADDEAADKADDEAGSLPAIAPVGDARHWRGGITVSWFALLVITLGIATLAYALLVWGPHQPPIAEVPAKGGPSVTVVEFQDLSGSGGKPVVAGLALELVTDLQAFDDIDARYGGGESTPAPSEATPSQFTLTGIVRRADQAIQYSAILTEAKSGAVVWSRTIPMDEHRAMQADALDEISRMLSLVLGSPRGPLHLPARQWLASDGAKKGSETPYLCHMLFALYREAENAASAGRAEACYDKLNQSNREMPLSLAAMGSLLAEGFVPTDTSSLSLVARTKQSGSDLKRATELAPLSAFVWEQQARWFELQGKVEAAKAAYASSIQLNPAAADALAAFARLLALQGHLDEAEPMANTALLGAPKPPAWYFAVPTLLALRDTHLTMAVSDAQTYATADPQLGSVLAVTAASLAGNAGVVSRYLPQVLEVAAFRASGILPQLRKRIGDEALLDKISVALETAGVPKAALSGPF